MSELPTKADTCTCRTKRGAAQVPLAPCPWHLKYRRAVRARKRLKEKTS